MAVTIDSGVLTALLQDDGACKDIGVNVAEAVFTDVFRAGDVTKAHEIREGVACNDKILFDNTGSGYDALGVVEACALPEANLQLDWSKKNWNPVRFGERIIVCYADLELAIKRALGDPGCTGVDMPEIVQNYITEILKKRANNGIWTKAWFGEAAATQSWLEGIDGLFIQLQDELDAAHKVTITENAGASYAAQAVTAENAYAYFQAMADKAMDAGFYGDAGIEIWASREMVYQYYRNARDKKIECCFNGFDGMQAAYSIDNLAIEGFKINIAPFSEIVKGTYGGTNPFNNGTKWTSPNRAVMAPRTNIPLGTCEMDQLKVVDVFYDKVSRQFYFDVEFSLDAKLLDANKAILAM